MFLANFLKLKIHNFLCIKAVGSFFMQLPNYYVISLPESKAQCELLWLVLVWHASFIV